MKPTVLLVFLFGIALVACGDDSSSSGDDDPAIDAPAATGDGSTTGDGGGTTGDGGTTDDGGTTTDDGGTTTVDGGMSTPDASVGVECGTDVCDPTTEECCVSGGTSTCVATDTCGGVVVDCDGPEDCADGQVCCLSADGATCGSADTCGFVACHVDEDCPEAGDECCELPLGNLCADMCFGPPGP